MKTLNEILDMCPDFYDRESFANGYLKGHGQAEKDLELTWEDIEKVCLIAREVHQFRGFWSESVYQEILKRFKEQKGGKK